MIEEAQGLPKVVPQLEVCFSTSLGIRNQHVKLNVNIVKRFAKRVP